MRWPNGRSTVEVLQDVVDEARAAAEKAASIAEKTRRRLGIGTLLEKAAAKTYTRNGRNQPSDACDEPIGVAQIECAMEYRNVPHVLRLHQAVMTSGRRSANCAGIAARRKSIAHRALTRAAVMALRLQPLCVWGGPVTMTVSVGNPGD